MDREEPRFDKADLSEVEFRPRAYRGPSRTDPVRTDDASPWRIGVAVGVAVLIALLLFNAYERYQDRKDAEQAMKLLSQQFSAMEQQATRELRALTQSVATASRQPAVKPIPPGFRCTNGVLLHHEGSTWTQITARSRQIYCPHGGTVDDCYPVTPKTVGCYR